MSDNDGDGPDPTLDVGKSSARPPSGHKPRVSAGKVDGIPKRFGRYRIEKKLGQGGMGAVYLARDETLDRPVAIKVPSFRRNEDKVVLERFYREARAAATLDHPNLCPVYDVGVIAGIHYLSMAYVQGRTLSTFIKAGGLPSRQVAALIRKIALALHEAHQKGIVHRDLKPANIMINRRREPVVMDFGLALQSEASNAKLTQSGTIVGTPAYMSPEQISSNGAVGPGSDIFSLGIIMYEMLVGRTPFQGDSLAVIGLILTEEPDPPSTQRPELEPEIESICLHALRKQPEERYGSMLEFADALRRFIVGSAMPETSEYHRPQTSAADTIVPPPAAATPSNSNPQAVTPAVESPPGEETLIRDMFADISGGSGTSTRRHRTRRRRKPVWQLWGGLAVAAIASFAAFYLIVRDGESETVAQSESTAAGASSMPSPARTEESRPVDSTRLPAQNAASQTEAGQTGISTRTYRETGATNLDSLDARGGDASPPNTSSPNDSPPDDWEATTPSPTGAPKSTSKKEKPVTPPSPKPASKRPLVVGNLPDDSDSEIRIDGRSDDWDTASFAEDDIRDALDGDWPRDIVQVSSEYTVDSLYIMLKTSAPPSLDMLAYWVDIDVSGDNRNEFQIGFSRKDDHVFWRMPPNEEAYAVNVSGVQYAIDKVVEMRIPWAFLRHDLPAAMASLMPKETVPLNVRCHCFSYDRGTDKRPDSTKYVASRRRMSEAQELAVRIGDVKRLGPTKWESIWIRDATTPWEVRSSMKDSDLQLAVKSMRRRKLTLTCLRGYTGDDGQPRFAAVWAPGPTTEFACGLTQKELEARFADGRRKRLRPVFVSAWSWNGQTAFNAIWIQDVSTIQSTWAFSDGTNLTRHYEQAEAQKLGVQGVTAWSDTGGENRYLSLFANYGQRPGSRIYDESDYRQNIGRLAVNARPVYVDCYRSGNSLFFPVCWMYDNDKIPDWRVETSQGVDGFDQLVGRMKREKYRPLCVAVAR